MTGASARAGGPENNRGDRARRITTEGPSCRNCALKREGHCTALCDEMRRALPSDRTGKAHEVNNDLDLGAHPARPRIKAKVDFSKLLEFAFIYTANEVTAVRLLHEGHPRKAVCEGMSISNGRLSQLIGQAKEKFRKYYVGIHKEIHEEMLSRLREEEKE